MRLAGAWKWKLALALGLTSAVAWAADKKPEAAASTPRSSWFRRWFTPPVQKPAKSDKVPPSVALRPTQAEEAALRRDQEEKALIRRLQVIDELNRVALETQDEFLSRKADDLNQRVLAAYSAQASRMPGAASFESDEKTLEKHLGAGAGNLRATGVPPTYTQKGKGLPAETAAREEE